jgi:hypothetical protein
MSSCLDDVVLNVLLIKDTPFPFITLSRSSGNSVENTILNISGLSGVPKCEIWTFWGHGNIFIAPRNTQLACRNVGTIKLDHVNARCTRGNLCMGTYNVNVGTLYGNVRTLYGNMGTLYGNVGTLYGNVSAHCGNVGTRRHFEATWECCVVTPG